MLQRNGPIKDLACVGIIQVLTFSTFICTYVIICYRLGGVDATFTAAELAYLADQRLGRLATLSPEGSVYNNPVTYFVDASNGWIDIGGVRMDRTQKYRNILKNRSVSLVVDDIKSLDPWRVRGLEIRGHAEAVVLAVPLKPHQRPEIIRIHPRRILSWGLEEGPMRMLARTVDE
jgi:pyridoxamine 5'-phosphate oxidase family protein